MQAGEYASVSEVVREGIRLWQQSRDRDRQALRELAAEIGIGWQELERGERVPFDMEAVIARMRART